MTHAQQHDTREVSGAQAGKSFSPKNETSGEMTFGSLATDKLSDTVAYMRKASEQYE